MFLTATDLLSLTGRARSKAQAAFLRSRQIRHVINKAGKVVVMKEWLISGEKPIMSIEPNFGALR